MTSKPIPILSDQSGPLWYVDEHGNRIESHNRLSDVRESLLWGIELNQDGSYRTYHGYVLPRILSDLEPGVRVEIVSEQTALDYLRAIPDEKPDGAKE